MKKDTDFRAAFAHLPDDSLIDMGEFGAVAVMPTRAAVYKAIERHPDCMPPVVRLSDGPRAPIRFRVGDVREWIRQRAGVASATGDVSEPMSRPAARRGGRQRLSTDVPGLTATINQK